MNVAQTNVTLDEVHQFVALLEGKNLDIERLKVVLESDDPPAALAEMLHAEPVYPRQWGKIEFYAYEYEEGVWRYPVSVSVNESDLVFKVCADCGTCVWISIHGKEHHISKRIQDFVQVTPDLLIKPGGRGIQVRRPQAYSSRRFCPYAAD